MKGLTKVIGIGTLLMGSTALQADIVHLDDVITDGSHCIGIDCVNGENFGFDTLRLKENNLRVHFDDTSASASFPANDWRIIINDSANGGANYFAVEDATAGRIPFRIESGAIVNALYVDSDGDVGIGTSTPVVELHAVDGNTPTLRLEQNGSSGFAPQTWDMAGNETNFFIRDVTNGSKLPFKIKPGAPDDSLYVAANGNVGIGNANPTASLHVKRSGPAKLNLTNGVNQWVLNSNNTMRLTSGGASAEMTIAPTTGAVSNTFYVAGNGNIGMGLNNPTASLHVKRSGPAKLNLTNGVNQWVLNSNNTMKITSGGANAELVISPTTGDVTILGTLTTGGTSCGGGCDLVFAPETEIESIEEHASQMWSNSYLPSVGPTKENMPINLSEKTGGILNELEKAHIYIEQLHNRMKLLEEEQAELKLIVTGLMMNSDSKTLLTSVESHE